MNSKPGVRHFRRRPSIPEMFNDSAHGRTVLRIDEPFRNVSTSREHCALFPKHNVSQDPFFNPDESRPTNAIHLLVNDARTLAVERRLLKPDFVQYTFLQTQPIHNNSQVLAPQTPQSLPPSPRLENAQDPPIWTTILARPSGVAAAYYETSRGGRSAAYRFPASSEGRLLKVVRRPHVIRNLILYLTDDMSDLTMWTQTSSPYTHLRARTPCGCSATDRLLANTANINVEYSTSTSCIHE